MKGEYLVQIQRPYYLYQIAKVGKKNYITSNGIYIDKETLRDSEYIPSQYRFATEDDIKLSHLYYKNLTIKDYKKELQELLDILNEFKSQKYVQFSDTFFEELNDTIRYLNQELTEEY